MLIVERFPVDQGEIAEYLSAFQYIELPCRNPHATWNLVGRAFQMFENGENCSSMRD